MEHLSGKDLYKTLKNLDIETGSITSESLDWLFDNKESNAILTWLCTYINENNVETYRETTEYASIQKEEIEISSEYINNVFNSNPTFSHILNADVKDINALKKNMDNAKFKEDHLDKLTTKYLNVDSALNLQVGKLQEEEINVQVQHNNMMDDCKKKAKKIDDLHENVSISIEKVHNTNKTDGTQSFFYKLPLDSYIVHSESLITNLNLWIRKNMELNNDHNNTNVDMSFIESELSRMKYAIEDSIINQVKSECAEKELLARLHYTRQNSLQHVSFEDDRVQEIQITSRINTLHEDLNRLYATDLQRNAENFTNNLINSLLLKNAEMKLNKYQDILKTLKTINAEVKHALSQFLLIFLLLKTDKMQLQSIEKFIKDIYFYSIKYLKNYVIRTEIMSEIENNVSKTKPILSDALTLISDKYSIEEFQQQKVAIEDLENKLFVVGNQKYFNIINECEDNIKKAKEIIWCGPTMQAVLLPYEYLQSLSMTNYQLEKVSKLLASCMDTYTSTSTQIEKNRWLKYKRLLWMLFLHNPTKLIEVIDGLRTHVTEQATLTT